MCGFVGLVSSREVAAEIHLALHALQHRGQDSAGIATMEPDGTRFHVRRGLGTVGQAVCTDVLSELLFSFVV
jgi:amidophosphoribosyltransferase